MSGVDSHSEYMARMDIINSILELGKVHNELMTQEKQRQDYLRQPETKYKMPIKYMLDELYSNRDKVKGDKILSSLSEYDDYFYNIISYEFYSDMARSWQSYLNYYIDSPKEIDKSALKQIKKRLKEFSSKRDKLENLILDFEKKHKLSRNEIREYINPLMLETRELDNRLTALSRKTEILKQIRSYLSNYASTGFDKGRKYTRTEAEEIFDSSLKEFNPKKRDELIKQNLLNDLKEKERLREMPFEEAIKCLFNAPSRELANPLSF